VTQPPKTKRCPKCGVEFPATDKHFYRGADGYLRNTCKQCHNRRGESKGPSAEYLAWPRKANGLLMTYWELFGDD
jgi:hypothetical protein